MRLCPRCNKPGPFSKKTAGLKHTYCKECQRQYQREHYAANRSSYIDKAQRRKVALRGALNDLKRKPCADCGGIFNPWQMDFDHVRGTKVENISKIIGNGSSRLLREELAKCEVVCANCHRQRTYLRKNNIDICP
jgi:hypothetical protein